MNSKDLNNELGEEWKHNSYEGYPEGSLSQMDKATNKAQQDSDNGIKTEINDDDDRDHNDSTEDWNAENSKTGRHK